LSYGAGGRCGAQPPAVVSFTFGCPQPGVIAALRAAGSQVWVTVTTPEEAALATGHRAAAAAAGDTSRMNLWAGEGFRAATTRHAAEIVALLAVGQATG
jgi:NAD(P)H-dependent flavin oxidoreductase YrpB (nitropropane dioxygenase family)